MLHGSLVLRKLTRFALTQARLYDMLATDCDSIRSRYWEYKKKRLAAYTEK